MTTKTGSLHPLLYQANTRVWLTRIARQIGREASLDDIPDSELDVLATLGFEWIWLLGVWKTGDAGRAISRSYAEWRRDFVETLSDLTEDDVGGSCFAISEYVVSANLGGALALKRLRQRLAQRNLRLMLDFVPNHMAMDHSWVRDHPDRFIAGTEEDLARNPENYVRVPSRDGGQQILAHGRDPYFPGWPDTVQLNYANLEVQVAMTDELAAIAGQCDGVRCDMAMLLLPDVFQRTWGLEVPDFWPTAIRSIRAMHPGFVFLAEVYWNLEWTLQQQGFDYCYDKRLYDRLREGSATDARAHLRAGLDFQSHLARFLENHDEARAATAFPHGRHGAAAVVTFLCPGLRFFHQGQLEGFRKRISPHLVRGPEESADPTLQNFYSSLLEILRHPTVRNGHWQILEANAAWDGNQTSEDFLACAWTGGDGGRFLVTVNFAPHSSQCYLQLPWPDLDGKQVQLKDHLSAAVYEREGGSLIDRGLYLDVPDWHAHVFSVTPIGPVQDVPAT